MMYRHIQAHNACLNSPNGRTHQESSPGCGLSSPFHFRGQNPEGQTHQTRDFQNPNLPSPPVSQNLQRQNLQTSTVVAADSVNTMLFIFNTLTEPQKELVLSQLSNLSNKNTHSNDSDIMSEY